MINKPRIKLFNHRETYNVNTLYVRYVQLDLKDGSKPKVFINLRTAYAYVERELCKLV